MNKMNLFKPFLLFLIAWLSTGNANAQEGEDTYIYPEDPLVLQKLEQWQDFKFGLMMHWGTYSQWGIVESWSLCTEDWINRNKGRYENYDLYKIDYENLQTTFNPSDFNPEKWADAAAEAGMRYMVFTTKHHDGFCMFDTKTTDYKITADKTPFHSNPRANITKEIFDAFREKDFMIGAYFSKPDWHSEYYWWPYYHTGPRHVNYDPAKHPERWEMFKAHTSTQIEELMTDYGDVDILWLDGAWVRPYHNTPDHYSEWAIHKDWDQDIDIASIAAMARSHQPGLIVVDRWVAGKYENYLTPENRIPEDPVLVPWESPITMAPGWSYNKNHRYKSVHTLVQMLVEVVAKGGNFLLNIGPSPEGDWAPEAYERLKGIGEWMQVNKDAIYNTRAVKPYRTGKLAFTGNRDGSVNVFYLANEEENTLPPQVFVDHIRADAVKSITIYGSDAPVVWEANGPGIAIQVPETVQQSPPCDHVWVFRISLEN